MVMSLANHMLKRYILYFNRIIGFDILEEIDGYLLNRFFLLEIFFLWDYMMNFLLIDILS